MQQILDLHIHSKYSRACSPQLTLENIAAACRIKGVDIVATGDFTYPAWFSEIKNKLAETEQGSGLFKLKATEDGGVHPVKSGGAGAVKPQFDGVKFILSTEVALIYKDKDKVRRIHLVIHAPNLEAAAKLNNFLGKKYNLKADGRPILGMPATELVKICLATHPDFLVYPAHIWTPWFSVFGSNSGFNNLAECFGNWTENIYAYETGLSSDPEMNWRLSALDNLTLLSNSDAHSLANIGREANVFDLAEITYQEIYQIIKNKERKKIKYTIEFFPEEGKYHYDGHRQCNLRFSPSQTKKHRGLCPVCKKPLTVGVMNRVEELADRPVDFKPTEAVPYKKLVELDKIIAQALNLKARQSAKVQREYHNLTKKAGSEFKILLELKLEELAKITLPEIVEAISRVRTGELVIEPGFDGQYGTIKIFKDEERKSQRQTSLFSPR